jgi:hypothetical protein
MAAVLGGCDQPAGPQVDRAVDQSEETTTVQSRLDASCGGQAPNGLPWVHTRCGAPVVVFLDFDGGKYLNDDDGDGIDENAIHAPYDTDGDPTSYDPTEQDVIRAAVEAVGTWFAPFKVDVTTDPNTAGPRSWILISNDVESGGANTCGFPNNDGACSRVHSNYAEQHDGRGIVHELSHSFGMGHNSEFNQWGDRTETYGSALDPLHGMVMGAKNGVINKWVLWHGYGSVDGFQDQVQKLLDKLDDYGDPYVADDDVDSLPSTPRALSPGSVRMFAYGVLERPSDVDWYSVTTDVSGYYTIAVTRDGPSFVDVAVELYDGTATVLLAAEDGDPNEQPYQTVNDSFISPVWLNAGTTYKIRVASHGDYADFGRYVVRTDAMLSGINGNGTPMRWRSRDIGLAQVPGFSYAFDNAFFVGAHGDMTEVSEDAFHYMFQTLEGDGSITARVLLVPGSNSNSELGVMIRDGLSPQAPYVAIAASYNSTKRLLARDAAGMESIAIPVESGGGFSPVWVRLTRSGAVFTGEVADGPLGPWRLVSTRLVGMGPTVLIGVAAARTTGTGYGRIGSISTTGNVNPMRHIDLALPQPLISVANVDVPPTAVAFNLTTMPGASTLIEKSRDGVNYEPAGTFTTIGGQVTINGLRAGARYWFRGSSVFPDPLLISRYSPPVEMTAKTQPGFVTNVKVSNVAGRRDTTLNIEWNDISGEAGYMVQRATSASGPFTTLDAGIPPNSILPPNTPMYTDTGLQPNTNYFYRVRTYRNIGTSVFHVMGYSEVKSRYTALPTTTGGTVNSTVPTSVSMQCNSVAGATSYEIQRFTASGSTPTNLTSSTRTFTDTGLSPLQWYRYAMRGKNANTWSNDWTTFMAATPPDTANALPAGWSYADFGSVSAAGVAGMNSSGRFTVIGSGSRLSSDAGGVMAYSNQSGNPWIIARVASLSGVSSGDTDDYGWAQGGVMLRDSFGSNATFVAAYATRGRGLRVSYRRTDGGTVTTLDGPDVAAPVKLRVRRTGTSAFDVAYAPDGSSTWTSLGTIPSVTMDSAVRVGLFANAGDNQPDQMEVARFTEVETNFSGGVYP